MPKSADRGPDGHTHRWDDAMWLPPASGRMRVRFTCTVCGEQLTRDPTAAELKKHGRGLNLARTPRFAPARPKPSR